MRLFFTAGKPKEEPTQLCQPQPPSLPAARLKLSIAAIHTGFSCLAEAIFAPAFVLCVAVESRGASDCRISLGYFWTIAPGLRPLFFALSYIATFLWCVFVALFALVCFCLL